MIKKPWYPHWGHDFIFKKHVLHICILESNVFPIHITWVERY